METWIIIILMLALVIFYFYQQGREDKYKESFGDLERNRAERIDLEEQNERQREINKQLKADAEQWQQSLDKANAEIANAMGRFSEINAIVQEKQHFLDTGISQLESEKRANLDLRLKEEEKIANAHLEQVKQFAEQQAAQWTEKAEDARQKYLSVMEMLRQEQEVDEAHVLNIPQTVRDDISFLLETVVPRLSNKEKINKFIWQEYIQSYAKDLLNNILPSKECSGIYKITNLQTKKSYIGRSTDLNRRLSDHIKSSCGVASSTDQKIHQAMREEGLWNFSFDILEECDKSKLGEREKYYIEFFQTQKYGYNAVAGSSYKEN